MHFLVKWKGYPISDNSWEPRGNLHADRLITEYNKKKQKQAEPKKKGIKSRRARTEEIIPSLFNKQYSHLHTRLMSAYSAPTTSANLVATRSVTPVSAPNNTPASDDNTVDRGVPPVISNEVLELLEEVAATSLQDYESEIPKLEYPSEGSDIPLQLGRWTVPIIEVATTVTSTINYEQEEENDEEDDEAPVGFILPFSPSLPSPVQNLQGMSLNVNADRAQSNASCALSANSSVRSGQSGMFSVSFTWIRLTCSSLGLSADWCYAYLWPW